MVAETLSCIPPVHDRQGKSTVYINHQFPLVDEGMLQEGKMAGQQSEYRLVCGRRATPGSGSTPAPLNLYDSQGRLENSHSIGGVPVTSKAIEAHGIELESTVGESDPPRVLTTTGKQELPEHLQCMLPEKGSLSNAEYERVKMLIHEFEDIFVGPDGKVGYTHVVKHHINTEPIKSHVFRKSLKEKEYVDEEITKMLEGGQIRPSKSPWGSLSF